MADPWLFLLMVLGVCAVAFAGLWVVCQRVGNAGYIDLAWAGAIAAALVVAPFLLGASRERSIFVAVLGGIWAFRLVWHLQHRLRSEEEDGRYVHMRNSFGDKAPLAFFIFFQMQAVFVVLFLAPIIAGMTRIGGLDWRDALGLGIWLVAVVGEAIADKQLADFRHDPMNQGKVCKRGLWRYSRHPNYFFEWVHWFAYLAIGLRFTDTLGYVALAGPIVMGVFLVYVTGIPYTEMRALQSKGEAYRKYQRETSAFFPWFPKADQGSASLHHRGAKGAENAEQGKADLV